jgi:hypothetical protein
LLGCHRPVDGRLMRLRSAFVFGDYRGYHAGNKGRSRGCAQACAYGS